MMEASINVMSEKDASTDHRRIRICIRGIVQGVGFRPFIYQLAREHALTGWVRNQSDGVEIEAAGLNDSIDRFTRDISAKAPPLSRISEIEIHERSFQPMEGFQILASKAGQARSTLISPDVCVCDDCLRELFDRDDRRYRYPFINCTNCGPRYTIIKDIPYDRDKTTMAGFFMCPACLEEYGNPLDRRFHAQPNACWECGPQVWVETASGEKIAERDEAVIEAMNLLTQGAIVAIKGLGGFHLSVDAFKESAVKRLRSRKIREEKPFALMFSDVEAVKRYCSLGLSEEALLTSSQRPIVLLDRLRLSAFPDLAASIAPRNKSLGAMLPYTPLHFLLFNEAPYQALVMTSGNQSDEPIVTGNREARERLAGIADYFLFHDREIYLRCDDSVTRVIDSKPRMVRRSRGFAPVPISMPASSPPVLGVGAELKNAVCVTRRGEAFLSQHIGDLENLETLESFELTISHLERILEVEPRCVVCDMHPDYLSTQWALNRKEELPVLPVQHHHAHIAAVIAERKIGGPVLGVALDGTGYGTDGAIWGGEILRVDGLEFERLGHFRYAPLPGGSKAIKEPWRMALSYLWRIDPENAGRIFSELFPQWEQKNHRLVIQMLDQNLNCPLTSSCGRLFDAVAAMTGLPESGTTAYEGQAAIELEQALEPDSTSYSSDVYKAGDAWILDPFPMVSEALRDVRQRIPRGVVSARFHNGVISMLSRAIERISDESGVKQIVLGGGVFQNAHLLESLLSRLRNLNFEVHAPVQIPANDACIALGQAYLGALWLNQSHKGGVLQ